MTVAIPLAPLSLIAYHEAGHVVAFLMAGMTDVHTMIAVDWPRPDAKTWSAPAIDGDPHQRIRRCMGGAAAELVVVGHLEPHSGLDDDCRCVRIELARLADTEDEREAIYLSLWQEMQLAFARPDVGAAVDAIASALLQRRLLGDAELREIAAKAGLSTTLPMDAR